jgi:hypothetical protein
VHLIFEFAEQQGIHLKNWTLTIFDYTVNLVNGRTIIVVIERVALERHKLLFFVHVFDLLPFHKVVVNSVNLISAFLSGSIRHGPSKLLRKLSN